MGICVPPQDQRPLAIQKGTAMFEQHALVSVVRLFGMEDGVLKCLLQEEPKFGLFSLSTTINTIQLRIECRFQRGCSAVNKGVRSGSLSVQE